MDPWCNRNGTEKIAGDLNECLFEDNFKPTVSETLPDSKQYLELLEKKLHKLKNDPNILRQLVEKREACFQQLLSEEPNYEQEENFVLESSVSTSVVLRTIAPERQAITTGEIVHLIKHDLLNHEEQIDNSDAASR